MDLEAREELRYALRRYLAARPTAACTLDMIQHGLRYKGIKATEDEITEELTYWIGLTTPQVDKVFPEHGSTPGYQITSAGRIAEARGQ